MVTKLGRNIIGANVDRDERVFSVRSNYKLNVLLMALASDTLSYSAEIEAIGTMHHVTPIIDKQIDPDRLQRAAEGKTFDMLYVLSHSDKDGVVIDDVGSRIPHSTLLRIARAAGATCVFLNSCDGISLAQRLVKSGVPSAISYIGTLNDKVAVSQSREFFRSVSKHGDLRAAYDSASDAEGRLVWLSNGVYRRQYEFQYVLEGIRAAEKRLYTWATAAVAVSVLINMLIQFFAK